MNIGLRKVGILCSAAALIFIGSIREFIFVNINYQLKYLYYEGEQSYAHSFFDFLNNYTYDQIYYSKWWLMAIFTVLFWAASATLINFVRPEMKWFRWITGVYIVLVVAAGLCFFFGWVFGDIYAGYAIARQILGAGHSPLPVMILIPAIVFFFPAKKSRQV